MSEEKKEFRYRRYKRAAVRLPVMLIHDESAYEGHMRELSRGGALIETQLQLSPGDELRLGFHIKNVRDPIELPIRVVYVHAPGADTRLGEAAGIGVEFQEVDVQLGARIDTYVKDQRFFGPYSTILREFQRARR